MSTDGTLQALPHNTQDLTEDHVEMLKHYTKYKYKLGDSHDKMIYAAAQADLIEFIETKILKRRKHGIPSKP